jgi:hypothetical protein
MAVSELVIVHSMVADIGRFHGASVPLPETVFQRH